MHSPRVPARLPSRELFLGRIFESEDPSGEEPETLLHVSRRELRELIGLSWGDYQKAVKALQSAHEPILQPGETPAPPPPPARSAELEKQRKDKEQAELEDLERPLEAYRRLAAADELAWDDPESRPTGRWTVPSLRVVHKLMLRDAILYEPLPEHCPPIASYSHPCPDPGAEDEYRWHLGYDRPGPEGLLEEGRLRMKLPVPLAPALLNPPPRD